MDGKNQPLYKITNSLFTYSSCPLKPLRGVTEIQLGGLRWNLCMQSQYKDMWKNKNQQQKNR